MLRSRLVSLILFVGAPWIACNPPPLDPGPDINVGGPLFSAGTEVSATFVYPFTGPGPFGTTQVFPERTVYQYNPGGFGGFAWSVWDGNAWANCNATGAAPCFVQPAPAQVGWLGDPVIASAPFSWVTGTSPYEAGQPSRGGYVVASSLGVSVSGNQDQVIVAISTDGGSTFHQGIQVNDGGCPGGKVDQQHITLDPNYPGDLWVAWRYAGAPVFPTYGICIRGGRIDPPVVGDVPTIAWYGSSHPVQNVAHEFGYGVGGVMVQPLRAGVGFGRRGVTVMYSSTDNFHKDCSPPGNDIVAGAITWFTNTTYDFGQTWSATHEIFQAPNFIPCTPGDRYIRVNRGTFAFQRDSSGTLWAAVNDTQDTAQIFWSSDDGVDWNYDATAIFPGLFHPTMSAQEDSGNVALFFYGATNERIGGCNPTGVGSTTTPLLMVRRPTAAVPGWTEPQQVGNTFCSVVLQNCTSDSQCPGVFTGDPNGYCRHNQCVGTRGLGDYQGMAFVPAFSGTLAPTVDTFDPAWSTQVGQVHTSFVGVEP